MFTKRWAEIENDFSQSIHISLTLSIGGKLKLTGGHITRCFFYWTSSRPSQNSSPGSIKDWSRITKSVESLYQASSSMTSPGVERVQMVKNRDIKGALATDQALREVVEKRVSNGIL